MKTFSIAAILSVAVALGAAAQAGKPVNAKCPLKSDQGAKGDITSTFRGVVVGFCCGNCKKAFDNDPENFVDRIPELKAAMKKSDKPEATGPCDCKKVVKGWYCEMCKRELKEDDVRGTVCKKCETKPEQIEFCLKRTYKPLTAEEIRKKLPPKYTDDLARVAYECDTCGGKAQVEKDVKHKDDCKPKFGGGLKKVCSKSGKAPHATDAK